MPPLPHIGQPGLATRNQGGQAASNSGYFYVRQHGTPFGRAVRETFGSAGSLIRFANLHGSALPFGDWRAEITNRYQGATP